MATGTALRAAAVAIVIAASWTVSHRAAAAADGLVVNPRVQPITVTASDVGSHSVALGVGKSVVIDLPHDIKDVLVGDPKIANAVVRSSRRAYIVGNGVGQTNVFFFDAEGRQMAGFDIAVTRDLNGIRAATALRWSISTTPIRSRPAASRSALPPSPADGRTSAPRFKPWSRPESFTRSPNRT
jgi:pilus assembly protein CpaC